MSKKLSWLLILAFVPFAIACSDDDSPTPTPDTTVDAGPVSDMTETDMTETDTMESDTVETDTVANTNFENIRLAAVAYLATHGTGPTATIKAPDLNTNLADGDDTNNPYILSVRSATDYAIGHIPGAANVPWKTCGTADLSALPTDNQIVVYCYTGHSGGLAAAALGAAGYDTINLKFGIMGWTKNTEVRVKTPFAEPDTDQATETTDNPGAGPFDPPDMSALTSTDTKALVLEAYGAYLTRMSESMWINAADLATNLNDGDDTNDPQIISVRGADHYALGHIPGAINIPWAEIADPTHLAKIDPSKPVVVYCYTGHTGQIAATMLGLMGYEVKNLLHGIMSWTTDATVRVASPFAEDSAEVGDYTFEGTAAN